MIHTVTSNYLGKNTESISEIVEQTHCRFCKPQHESLEGRTQSTYSLSFNRWM